MLNNEQANAVKETASNILLIAPPGSGKTNTLIHRAITKYGFLPENRMIALITYTNAGADEISSRMDCDPSRIFIGTIHSFCLKYILRPFGWKNEWRNSRILQFNELQQFVAGNFTFSQEINWIDELNKIQKNHDGDLVEPSNWGNGYDYEKIANKYFDHLDAIGAIDFNEVIRRSLVLVSNYDFIAKSLASRFYEILVDEFQDTNEQQYLILKRIISQNKSTSFFVGDPRQQILSFSGYIEGGFDRVTDDLRCKKMELVKAYRSSDLIVSAFQKLYPGDTRLENLSPTKLFSSQPLNLSLVSANIPDFIRGFREAGIKYSEIAVLATSWVDCLNASRLLRGSFPLSGIGALPHRSINSAGFSLLRSLFAYTIIENHSTFRVLKRRLSAYFHEYNYEPNSEEINSALSSLITKSKSADADMSLNDGLLYFKEVFEESLRFNHSVFDEIISREIDSSFRSWKLSEYKNALSGSDSIFVNTIHQSKGMEFDAVIMYCADEGKIPRQVWDRNTRTRLPLTSDSEADGRKLFYVAMSRARKHLVITHDRSPSMFTIEALR